MNFDSSLAGPNPNLGFELGFGVGFEMMSGGFQVPKGNMGCPVEPVGSEVAPVVNSPQDFESSEGSVAEGFGLVLEVSSEDFGAAPEVNVGCPILILILIFLLILVYNWFLTFLMFCDA